MPQTTRSYGLGRAPTVLLFIDMISDFRFPQGTAILKAAQPIAPRIQQLKARTAAGRIPCIYVNDNLGICRSDMAGIHAQCAKAGSRGAEVAALLAPSPSDLAILKPRQSAFYAPPLGTARLATTSGLEGLMLDLTDS